MSMWKCFQFPTSINVELYEQDTGTVEFKLMHMNATLLDKMFKEKLLFVK